MDNDYIEVLLKFEPPWTAELVKLKKKQKKPNNGTALAAAQIRLDTVHVVCNAKL